MNGTGSARHAVRVRRQHCEHIRHHIRLGRHAALHSPRGDVRELHHQNLVPRCQRCKQYRDVTADANADSGQQNDRRAGRAAGGRWAAKVRQRARRVALETGEPVCYAACQANDSQARVNEERKMVPAEMLGCHADAHGACARALFVRAKRAARSRHGRHGRVQLQALVAAQLVRLVHVEEN